MLHVVNVNYVEDHVVSMNENFMGKTFFFDVKDKHLVFNEKYEVHNLDLKRQVQPGRGYLFLLCFWDSIWKSPGLNDFYKMYYRCESKYSKIFVYLIIVIKSYISAYFCSLSAAWQVLFSFDVFVSVAVITVACASALAIVFLLESFAVILGCVGLVSMVLSFVGINWREPVEESRVKTKQVAEK